MKTTLTLLLLAILLCGCGARPGSYQLVIEGGYFFLLDTRSGEIRVTGGHLTGWHPFPASNTTPTSKP